MATTLYFRGTTVSPYGLHWTGGQQTRLDGVNDEYVSLGLATTRGAGVTAFNFSSVAGPTNGIEPTNALGQVTHDWVSAPLTADVTIAGTISFNVWGNESAMADNATFGALIQKIGPTGTLTTIGQGLLGTELPTTNAAQAWNVTPTSTVVNKGDRIRICLYADDATGVTMGAGGNNLAIRVGAASAGVSGDSYVTFTETISVQETDPSGSTVYLTNTASDVATAAVDREAWTSRGAGVQNDVTNTQAGFVSPIQITDTAGGTVVDWFTKPLSAFTLSGTVKYNIWVQESSSSANASLRVEIARVDNDGTNATVWANHSSGTEASTTAGGTAMVGYLSGDDLSISSSQRLRLRVYLEDSTVAMATGHTVTVYYAATSGGVSGDTFLIFEQTLEEATTLQSVTLGFIDASAAVYAPTIPAPTAPVVLGLIDGEATTYAPAVVLGAGGTQAIEPTLIDSSPAVYDLSLIYTQPITLGLIDGAAAVYAPTLAGVTTFYFSGGVASSVYSSPGVSTTEFPRALTTSSGSTSTFSASVAGSLSDGTVVEILDYWSGVLEADATLSGDITVNLRMWESVATVNVGAAIKILRVHPEAGTTDDVILESEINSEMGTSEAAQNWAVTLGSPVALKKGDRIRVLVRATAVGTSGAGTVNFKHGTGSDHSWIQLPAQLSFMSATAPAGSQLFATHTASDVSTANDDRALEFARGAGVQSATKTAAAGPVTVGAATQLEVSATDVQWYTGALPAMTLQQPVRITAWARRSSGGGATSSFAVELLKRTAAGVETSLVRAILNNDLLADTDDDYIFQLGFKDVSLADGDRLKVVFYYEDPPNANVASGTVVTVKYAASSAAAVGDTWLQLTQTIQPWALTLGLIDGGATVYDLTVVQGGSGFTVYPETLDSVRAVYAPSLTQGEGAPGEPYPDPYDGRYISEGHVIHVIQTTTNPSETFSALPTGPTDVKVAKHIGQSQQVFAHPNSPAEFDNLHIQNVGPTSGYIDAVYRGVSQPIHVFGDDPEEWPPEDPIPGCECDGTCQFSQGFVTGTPDWDVVLGSGADLTLTDTSILQAGMSDNGHVIELEIFQATHPTLFSQFVQVGLYFWMDFRMTQPAAEQNSVMSMYFSFGWSGSPGGTAKAGINYSYNSITELFKRTVYVSWPTNAGTETASYEETSGSGWGELSGQLSLQISSTGYTVTVPWGDVTGDGKYQDADPSAPTPDTASSLIVIDYSISNNSGYNFGAESDQYEELYWTLFQVNGDEFTPDWCSGQFAPCDDCDDPENPGNQIPPFTPGYMPIFRRQIGDPTTRLDSWICTLESGAMVLDWHTRGAVQVWGGELIPYCGKNEYEIIGTGTNLGNVRQAWAHWNQYLDVRTGQTWADLIRCLEDGRAVILQGDYGVFTAAESCQDDFNEGHAIAVFPYKQSGRILVGDPLCGDFKGIAETSLQAYAEAFGAQELGASTPQPIFFAVSKPWTP